MEPAEKTKDQLVLELQILTREHEELKQLYKLDLFERLKAEAVLKESENILSAVFNATDESIYLVVADNTLLGLNDIAAKRLGGSPQDFIGKDIFNLLPPDVVASRLPHIEKVISTKNLVGFDNIRHGRWMASRIYPILDEEGQVSRMAIFSRDITKQKQEEEKLRLSEEYHHRLFDTMLQGVVYIDANGEIVSVNPAAESILGISAGTMLGKYFINPGWGKIREDGSEINKHENPLSVALNDGKPVKDFIMGVCNPENINLIWLSLTMIPIIRTGEIKPYQLYITFQDITQLKNRELLLKQKSDEIEVQNIELINLNGSLRRTRTKAEENEIHFREVLENSLVASYKRNLQTNIYEYFSPVITKITGFSPDEMKSLPIEAVLDLIHPDDLPEINRVINASMSGLVGNSYQVDYRFKHKNGGYRWLFDQFSVVSDSSGCPVARIGSVNDITERKLAEEELRNTKWRMEGIIERNKDYDETEEFAGYVLQSSKRAMNLLENLMEWSRSQTGRMDFHPEHFEMVQFLGDIIPLFDDIAVQKSIFIMRDYPPEANVFADKSMISTVFRNLISNAIKFTQTGGRITLRIKTEESGVLVSVQDTGIGIPENMISKLFRIDQSYSTTGTNNEQGTGLGLILCKEFVEKHKGKIWVRSEVGKGSKFYFTLPGKMNA